MQKKALARGMIMADEKEKLVGCVFDPSSFKKPDGTLDAAAMAHEMFTWSQGQYKKIDEAKQAEADTKEEK